MSALDATGVQLADDVHEIRAQLAAYDQASPLSKADRGIVRTILDRLQAVRDGRLPMSTLEQRLERSPAWAQRLFRDVPLGF